MQQVKTDKIVRKKMDELIHQSDTIDFDEKQLWNKLELKLQHQSPKNKIGFGFWFKIAAILLLISSVTLFYILETEKKSSSYSNNNSEIEIKSNRQSVTINKQQSKNLVQPQQQKVLAGSLKNKTILTNSSKVILPTIVNDTNSAAKANSSPNTQSQLITEQNFQENKVVITTSSIPVTKKLKIVHYNELAIEQQPVQITKSDLKKIEKLQQEENVLPANTENNNKNWLFFKTKNSSNSTINNTTEN